MDELRHAAATLVADPPLPPTPVEDLQARNRRRHRRHRLAGAVALVVMALAGLSLVRDDPEPARVVTTPEAGRRDDHLAVVDDRGAVLLDGNGRHVVAIDLGVPATALEWSGDGSWLAVVADQRLHIVSRDGTDRRDVELQGVQRVQWLPDRHQVVATTSDGLWQVELDGSFARTLPGATSALWSANGHRVVYLAADGTPRVADTDGSHDEPLRAAGPFPDTEAGMALAAISPDGSWVLYWGRKVDSESISADGLSLVGVHVADDRTTMPLGTMLARPDWLRWSPDGRKLLMVAHGGRFIDDRHELQVCEMDAHRCKPVPRPAGTSAFDAAWSPNGDRIAFTTVPVGQGGTMPERWSTARLWVVDADTTGVRLPRFVGGAGGGPSQAMWTIDGAALLYVLAGELLRDPAVLAIDRIPLQGGTPKRIHTSEPGPSVLDVHPGRVDVALAWSPAATSGQR